MNLRRGASPDLPEPKAAYCTHTYTPNKTAFPSVRRYSCTQPREIRVHHRDWCGSYYDDSGSDLSTRMQLNSCVLDVRIRSCLCSLAGCLQRNKSTHTHTITFRLSATAAAACLVVCAHQHAIECQDCVSLSSTCTCTHTAYTTIDVCSCVLPFPIFPHSV